MKILADRILILPEPAERKTASGLLLPDTVTSTDARYVYGTVKAVGPGRRDDHGRLFPPTVQVGQRVLYNRDAEHELDVLDIAHVLVREDDIIAEA